MRILTNEMIAMVSGGAEGDELTYCTPAGIVCGTAGAWGDAYDSLVLRVSDWMSDIAAWWKQR